ncbi:MAG: hypothetical protein ACHQ7M_18385, partial [Chloroflexota bacterium]
AGSPAASSFYLVRLINSATPPANASKIAMTIATVIGGGAERGWSGALDGDELEEGEEPGRT